MVWRQRRSPAGIHSPKRCEKRVYVAAPDTVRRSLERRRHRRRQEKVASYGLEWDTVESVPVSEDIKLRSGDFERHIENYKQTIRNLAARGIKNIIYNFMPVLDWIRTDLHYRLPDGSRCLRFDPVQFAAFEIYLLKREGAEKNYTQAPVRSR